MSIITRQDTNGVKPLLQVGELGYDNFPTGGDVGRVYVGTGTSNIAQAKKSEVMDVDSKVDAHVARDDNPHGVTKAQVGLDRADNTNDLEKPVSTATQDALDLKADLASPALTGTPTAPTADVGTSTTQLATTEYVKAEIIDVSYTKDDVYTKVETDNLLDLKADIESPIFTGIPEADTAVVGTNTKQLATTEYVKAELVSEVYSKVQLDAGQLDSRYYTQTQVDDMLNAQNDASEISYDNTVSGLVAANVQDAVDEVEGRVDTAESEIVRITDEITDANMNRADKWLASQNIAQMLYDVNGDLAKLQYIETTDNNYETFSYTNGDLTGIAHYVDGVLKGNTVLSYTDGNLVSVVFTEV